jgi:hypothetical protein
MVRTDPLDLYKAEKELQMELEKPSDLRTLAIRLAEHVEDTERDSYIAWCEKNNKEVDNLRKNIEHIYAAAMVFSIDVFNMERKK